MKMLIQLHRKTKELSQNFSDLNKDLNILRKDITQLKNITVENHGRESTENLMTQKNGPAIRKTG